MRNILAKVNCKVFGHDWEYKTWCTTYSHAVHYECKVCNTTKKGLR